MKQIILFAGMFILISLYSCDKQEIEVDTTCKYEVTCNPAGFDVTYDNVYDNTEQQTIDSTSWETSFQGYYDDWVYCSAQANNENATITVKIYYKGVVIEKATSSGDYVIATASGTLD